MILGMGAAAGVVACGDRGIGDAGKKLGVAVVGLGSAAVDSFIPTVNRSPQCRLAGLVDVDAERLRALGRRFGVPGHALYTQDSFDRIAENPDIDLVYIAAPNALHAEYTIRAARAGKHVLCEKPMAVTVAECRAMIEACDQADRLLAIAYRLHYSPHHQEMVRSLREKRFGQLKIVRADIGYPLRGDIGWRASRKLAGGGALLEQGVYSVRAACLMTGEFPTEVRGYDLTVDTERFAEVEGTVSWTMQFPSGVISNSVASYSTPANHIWAGAQSGWFTLDRPFSPGNDISAETSSGAVRISHVDQFAMQTEHFCELIRNNQRPGPGISGLDGMRDVHIINSIYESIRAGHPVKLTPI